MANKNNDNKDLDEVGASLRKLSIGSDSEDSNGSWSTEDSGDSSTESDDELSRRVRRHRSGRRYGYYKCTDCKRLWESAQAFPKKSGGWYTQDCQKCRIPIEPYRTMPIKCRYCGNIKCTCDKDSWRGRHNDDTKPHIRELCEKCQSGDYC